MTQKGQKQITENKVILNKKGEVEFLLNEETRQKGISISKRRNAWVPQLLEKWQKETTDYKLFIIKVSNNGKEYLSQDELYRPIII